MAAEALGAFSVGSQHAAGAPHDGSGAKALIHGGEAAPEPQVFRRGLRRAPEPGQRLVPPEGLGAGPALTRPALEYKPHRRPIQMQLPESRVTGTVPASVFAAQGVHAAAPSDRDLLAHSTSAPVAQWRPGKRAVANPPGQQVDHGVYDPMESLPKKGRVRGPDGVNVRWRASKEYGVEDGMARKRRIDPLDFATTRNGIGMAKPGDTAIAAIEYTPGYFKAGATVPGAASGLTKPWIPFDQTEWGRPKRGHNPSTTLVRSAILGLDSPARAETQRPPTLSAMTLAQRRRAEVLAEDIAAIKSLNPGGAADSSDDEDDGEGTGEGGHDAPSGVLRHTLIATGALAVPKGDTWEMRTGNLTVQKTLAPPAEEAAASTPSTPRSKGSKSSKGSSRKSK